LHAICFVNVRTIITCYCACVTVKLINMLLCTVTSHVVSGWAESSPVESRPILCWADFGPVSLWAGSGLFGKFYLKELFKYVFFWKFVDALFINICLYFLYGKDTSLVWKYPVFVETSKNIKWKMFCFPAYGQYPNIVFTFFFI